jgi:drug/metabolite transporter (DMT)-like permease
MRSFTSDRWNRALTHKEQRTLVPGRAIGLFCNEREIRNRHQTPRGQIAYRLTHVDLVILDELHYLPFSQSGGALFFYLLSKLYERTSLEKSMTQFSKGLIFGLLGVACFSLTLPATRFAVIDLDPIVVAMGRALVAGTLSLSTLLVFRQQMPDRSHWLPLALVALGAVIGFPVFTTWAMVYVDASHGAIVLGILPLSTACFAVLIGHERPSMWFWLASVIGSGIVITYAVHRATGQLAIYDLILLGAVASAGMAYAFGAKLAKSIGSWQVICWALVLSLPVALFLFVWRVQAVGFAPHLPSLMGFAYVSVFSMFLGFFAWYKGLALGGTAKVGLVQLLQPFMTMGASWVLLGETLSAESILVAAAVSSTVMLALKARVQSTSPIAPTISSVTNG